MKKRILAALLAASMAFCAGCGSQSDDTAEDDQTPSGTAVEVTEVTQGAMSTEYSVNGKVAADNEVQVFPMLAGQVLTLSVSEGDKVSKGQTLLSVDTSTVTSTMSSLRESYNATKTATDKAIEICMDAVTKRFTGERVIRYGEVKHLFQFVLSVFGKLKLDKSQKKKLVGIVGEIYVKFSPLGNNRLEEFLLSEGCEPVLPGLMDFCLYCI